MKIGIVGTGYVGLISSVCFSDIGHTVISYDINETTISTLQQGKVPIYEKDIEQKLAHNLQRKTITFTTDITELSDCKIVLVAVGTPSLPNGDADLSQVSAAIQDIVSVIPPTTLLALRSTIPIGTTSSIRKTLTEQGKQDQLLGFCPEFLREGRGIEDFLHPSLLVFASDNNKGLELLQKMYQPIIEEQSSSIKLIHTHSFETAELIKYSINSFLATKITFINQIAQFALKTHADIDKIIEAMASDNRINKEFLTPGPGFGGSCFPKDTIALFQRGLDYHVNLSLIQEVNAANRKHKNFIATWVMNTLTTHYRTQKQQHRIGVWGLTFKANTDDVRESASVNIIQYLLEENFIIHAHDPKGIPNFQRFLTHNNLSYSTDALSMIPNVDVLIILTEWEEYRQHASHNIAEHFANTIVFDTRGICSASLFSQANIPLYKFGV